MTEKKEEVNELNDAEIEKLIQMVLVLEGQDRYAEVLQIWSKYIQMVFEEQRTKANQSAEIRASLQEQDKLVRARAAQVPPEERNMIDAAEILAIDFITPIVNQAFDFSTYSGARRCSYIRDAIGKEVQEVLDKVNPLRYILEEFKETEEA